MNLSTPPPDHEMEHNGVSTPSCRRSDVLELPNDAASVNSSADSNEARSIISGPTPRNSEHNNPDTVHSNLERISDADAITDEGTCYSSLFRESAKTSLSGSVSLVTDGTVSIASSGRLTTSRRSSQASSVESSERYTTTKELNKPRHSNCDSEIPAILNDSSADTVEKTELKQMLDTKALGVIGRDQEIATLRKCFDRLTIQGDENDAQNPKSECQNELVFISGYSGIGKSSLAETLKKHVSSTKNGVYVEGKYAFSSIDEPYTGLAQVFGELCNKFKECDPEVICNIGKTIADSMQEEAEMLMNLIPELSLFQNDEDKHDQGVPNVANKAGNDHERWKHAFRILIRILGSHFSPVVIVLDDVHWADISSLDILDCLISDMDNPRPLMVVGCYRSNEVDENSMLFNRIRTLKAKQEKFRFRITDIVLQNFDRGVVNKMVMTLLSIRDESKSEDLSKVCYKRTLGNPFFLIEFMKMLQSDDLLVFRSRKWVWDASRIEDATVATTQNVVDLLQAPMKKLPADIQLLLQYAACLGSTFSFSTLRYVWKNHALKILESADPDVIGILEVLQDANLLVSTDRGELEWVHDKVQEAALSLSDLVTPWFQFGLGVCLYEGLSTTRLEKQIFVVADLINKCNVTQRVDLAKLNLRAAKKARKMAAFQSGANYVFNGIKQLPECMWTAHRELTLELYSLGAEMNLMLGNITKSEGHIQTVLDRGEFTPMETIHMKMMKVTILESVQLRPTDAANYAIAALREIGYKFMWNKRLVPVQVLAVVTKTVKRLEKLPVDHFEKARLMEDPKQIAIVNMLSRLQVAAYNGNDIFLNFLCICKVIELTIEHGIHVLSAARFASLGATTMFLKTDHALSSHICDVAWSIQKRFGVENASETIHIIWAFVLCYCKPMFEALNPTLEGYSQGLREGDLESSITHLVIHNMYVPYIMGRPLGSILRKLERIAPQLEESKQMKVILPFRVGWQMMINLQLPPSENSKKLEGDKYSFSLDEYAGVPTKLANESLGTGELLLFFGDHEARVKLLMGKEKGNSYAEQLQGYFVGRIETFHRGIAWFAMAQKTRNRKYKAEAMKVMKIVAKWAKAGDPNVQHYNFMMKAEHAALSKKYDRADELYKQAISHAVRIDHLHHAALFHERFADYRLNVRGNRNDGKYHLEQAIRYYNEWGAIGKALHLQNDLEKI